MLRKTRTSTQRPWNVNNTGIAYLVMVALFLGASLWLPGFMRLSNIHNVLQLASFLGIAAIGQTLVILAGGIDLSVGAVMTFADIMVGQFVYQGLPAGVAIALVLLLSLVIGLLNGLASTWLGIPPLITTFAMGFILQGSELVLTGGTPQGTIPGVLVNLATKSVVGVPYIFLFWVLFGTIATVLLRKTVFGQNTYAIGIQKTVARLVGVNTGPSEVKLYVISSGMAAIAGLLLAGYSGSAYLAAGDAFTLETVAAVVIGGASILGGSGSYVGTFAGTIIFTIITVALTVTNVSEAGKLLMEGVLIIVLLLVYRNRNAAA